MSSQQPRSISSAPNGRLVDFEEAVIKSGFVGGTRFLRVRGTMPDDGLVAKLAPRIYSAKPDWWVIEVVGMANRQAEGRAFEASVPIDGVTGTEGILVIGAAREERFPNN